MSAFASAVEQALTNVTDRKSAGEARRLFPLLAGGFQTARMGRLFWRRSKLRRRIGFTYTWWQKSAFCARRLAGC
jgi:hypothetical protein